MTLQWYVLKSKPNKEDVLYGQVTMRGFEAFFPCLDVNPVNPRARKTKPYFPGYMFVRVALGEVGLSAFQWMPYAAGLVSFDKEPAIIPNDMMRALCKSIEALQKKKVVDSQRFQPGNMLTVNEGPFAGYGAIFDTNLPGNDRIRILLMLARGRQMSVELPGSYVQMKE